MTFVNLFAAGYFIFILALEKAFGLDQAVLVSKVLMMSAALLAVFTRKTLLLCLLAALAMIFVVFFSAIFTRFSGFDWEIWIRALNNVVTPFFLLSVVPTARDRDHILMALSFGPLISLAVGLAYQLMGVGEIFGAGGRLQGSLIPAFLAGISLTGAISSFLLSDCRSKKYLWIAIVNIIILMLTAARMPIAIMALIGIYYFVFELRIGLGRKVTAVAAAPLMLALFLATIGRGIVDRISNASDSGRDILWRYYWSVFLEYRDFGVGLGHIGETITRNVSIQVGLTTAPHNEFIRLFTEIGMIPAVIFWLLYILIAITILVKSPRGRRMVALSFVSIIAFCVTDNALVTPTYYPLLFAVSFWALSSRSKRRDDARADGGLRQSYRNSKSLGNRSNDLWGPAEQSSKEVGSHS